MKIVKTIAIVILVGVVAALVAASAWAQQPTPLPHVQMAIPVTPPPGWDPKQWAGMRARCQWLADRAAAHVSAGHVAGYGRRKKLHVIRSLARFCDA